MPVLGFELYSILQLAGQLTAALILDHVGFLGMPKKQASMSRIGGVVVVLLGCILCESALQSTAPSEDEVGAARHLGSSSFILAIIVAGISGFMLPLQACVNRRVSARLPVKGMGALISFTGGLILLAVVNAVFYLATSPGALVAGLLRPGLEVAIAHGWMLSGERYGACAVTAAILLSPLISVTGFSVALILGTLVLSIIADTYGFFGFDAISPTSLRVMGAVVAFIGVVTTLASSVRQSGLRTELPTADLLTENARGGATTSSEGCESPLEIEPSGDAGCMMGQTIEHKR